MCIAGEKVEISVCRSAEAEHAVDGGEKRRVPQLCPHQYTVRPTYQGNNGPM